MSVFVEGLALVVRRAALEARFPGGTRAFVHGACRADTLKFVCADREIVGISFPLREYAADAVVDLTRAGLRMADDADEGDFALVEDQTGPVPPCTWLRWISAENRAAARVWAAPSGRRNDSLAGVVSADASSNDADDEGRMRLCEEDGVVTWLDLRTGSFLQVPAKPVEEPKPLRALIAQSLDERQCAYTLTGDHGLVTGLRTERGHYQVIVSAGAPPGFIVVCSRYGPCTPVDRRQAVSELVSRVNFRLAVGNFEIDFGDGEVGFRVTLDARIGQVTVREADDLLCRALNLCDHYHDVIMQVAFGGVDPQQALASMNST
jgi:hypothetical protein